MLNDFWSDAEVIDYYSDREAIEDGFLINVAQLNIGFNKKVINRITIGISVLLDWESLDSAIQKNRLLFISGNSIKDEEGEDAWGIFEPQQQLGNEKLWLVGNELNGYTLMLPSEY